MADNLLTGSTGSSVAFDDISSVFYARHKLIHGADGVNDGDVSTANPFPVRLYFGTTAVTVGAGAVGTGVQRVTLASDDPLVVSGQLLDDAIVADDAAFTPATTKVMMAGFTFDDAAPDSVNEGDAGAARMSANRCIYINVRDNAGNERGLNIDSNGALAVSTVTTVTAVTSITNALPAGTNAIGKLAANTGVDIGDVDVTSVVPGTAATSLGKAIDSVAGATDTIVGAGVVRDDSLTTLTPEDGDWTTLRVDSTGQLWVTMGLTVYTTDAVAPASPVGLASLAIRDDALTTLTPANDDWGGPLRVDSVGALWVRDRAQLADDAAFSPATSFVTPVGFMVDESATDSADEGDAGIARMTADRKQIVTEYPHTAGGLTMSKTVSAASTNATSVKGSAGKVYSIQASNVNAAVRYLKLYDKATAPSVGSDTPVKTLALQGGTVGKTEQFTFPTGLEFTLGIAFALTTEATDAGSTGVSANEHVVNIDYR